MSHSVEFTCQDCSEDIIVFGHHDGLPVCQMCRLIWEMPIEEERREMRRLTQRRR